MDSNELIQKFEAIGKCLRVLGIPEWHWEIVGGYSSIKFHAHAVIDGVRVAFTITPDHDEYKNAPSRATGNYGDLMKYMDHNEAVVWTAVDLDDEPNTIVIKLMDGFFARLRAKFMILEQRKATHDKTSKEQKIIADDLVASCKLILHDVHDPNSFVIRQSKASEGLYITGEVRSDCTKLELTLSHEAAKEVLVFLEGLTGNSK